MKTENIQLYYDTVINGILAKMPESYKKGIHKIDYKYVLDCISSYKNEHGEYDVMHPFTESIGDAYEWQHDTEKTIEIFFSGVKSIYEAHMSVL